MSRGAAAENAGEPVVGQDDAVLCRWLATLLSAELDEDTLASYRRGDAGPLFDLLRERGLSEASSRVEKALKGLVLLPEPRLELAADFAELFLVDGRSAAPPYASLYTEPAARLHGEAAARMEARLAAAGFAVKDGVGEPADHLAVMLDYLASALESASPAADSKIGSMAGSKEGGETPGAFIRAELSPWLPALARRCERVSTASDFYPAVVALASAYVDWLSQNQ
ncbi:molecular chaperone TorD [Halomonas piscis]|uniref:Molecular chaperone TorD n=1 Tax=Halomonas piscis TaxID=3031727 RepID=A0ABY9Z128_9GAMM|nr:molecular chaperone TorD [Halomonas piscis]WNK20726.1 molecular chaperone TorD [Halomonas piscis]